MGAREPLAESYTYPEPVFHEPASVPGNSRAALVVAPGIGDVHIASGALPDLSQSAAKAPGGDLGVAVAVAFFQPQLGERFLILRFVPCFLGGVIAWRLIREGYRRRLPDWLWPVAIVTVSLIWMTANKKYYPLSIGVFGLCFGVTIPLFREIQWNAARTGAKIIARYSYGIYLTHFPIMVFVLLNNRRYPRFKIIHQLPPLSHYARPINTTLVLLFTAGASLALYHLIEDPGIRLGQAVAGWATSPYAQKLRHDRRFPSLPNPL